MWEFDVVMSIRILEICVVILLMVFVGWVGCLLWYGCGCFGSLGFDGFVICWVFLSVYKLVCGFGWYWMIFVVVGN